MKNDGAASLMKFKEGAQVKVFYSKGDFSLIETDKKDKNKKLQKGDLSIVRFVKAVQGKGITVQLSQQTFGFIPICEVTDDIVGRVLDTQLQTAPVFLARVIDIDQKHSDKLILSSRESVINDE